MHLRYMLLMPQNTALFLTSCPCLYIYHSFHLDVKALMVVAVVFTVACERLLVVVREVPDFARVSCD